MSTTPVNTSLTISTAALEKLKNLEGFSPTPYWDHKQWSIGYGSYAGSTDRNKKPTVTVTKETATAMLRKQVATFEAEVRKVVKVALTQYQWDAVILFVYNLGAGILTKASSTYGVTLADDLNAKNFTRFAERMKAYNKASGVTNEALVKRRIFESNLFARGYDFVVEHKDAFAGLAGVLLFFSSLIA